MSSIKVCAATNHVTVADPVSNAEQIISIIDEASQKGTDIVAFPELALTGATCGDLFMQEDLILCAGEQFERVLQSTKGKDTVVILGMPLLKNVGSLKVCNSAVVIQDGNVLGLRLKGTVENSDIGDETRWFEKDYDAQTDVSNFLYNRETKVFTDEPLRIESLGIDLGIVIGERLNVFDANVDVVVNMNARAITADQITASEIAIAQSYDSNALTIYVEAGEGESTTDAVFAGQNNIVLGDKILASSNTFDNENIYAQVELDDISTYKVNAKPDAEEFVESCCLKHSAARTKHPFIPEDKTEQARMCETILSIQKKALVKRLKVVRSEKIVIGVSGGLDSTLALIAATLACNDMGIDRSNIVAVTMPGFGTTTRTHSNATDMMKSLGVTFREIPIAATVEKHFEDIGHDVNDRNATYENAQARMRTMILMDLANDINGLVVGTGDLSELALGWATYNGDHMSMYAVNGDVPKTVIRVVVGYVADELLKGDYLGEGIDNETLSRVLKDIVDTPVSPELLPANEDDSIAQKTEDLVGPYELHDFFVYYVLNKGYNEIDWVYNTAVEYFAEDYDEATIKHWLKTFYRRFFTQQFKRSCMPDGPKVYSRGLSPRGGWMMPSDASSRIWLDAIEGLE